MRTLDLGLRVADLERSIAVYTSIGYEVLGDVPATDLGTLTMLTLPGDEFVALELVHDPAHGGVAACRLSPFVIQRRPVDATVSHRAAPGTPAEEPAAPGRSGDTCT